MLNMSTTISLLWWNLYNLHDDIDDPRIHDIVRPTRLYHRDLREVADIIDRVNPVPDIVGCAEVENHGVMRDLANEIHWRPAHHSYRCDQHVESRDPRGIDVGALVRVNPQVSLVRLSPLWPNDSDAVRPMIVLDLMVDGVQPLTVVLTHGKSRRSGACDAEDPMPGSRLRMSYGRALRQLAEKCGAEGVPMVAMGDFNDEPTSRSMTVATGAHIGRPSVGMADAGTLYNISREGLGDARGTCMHDGNWLLFDQVLVNGVLLNPSAGGLQIDGRVHIIADDPLLYRGTPNRWYSDHLPVLISLRRG
jgi:endonuclease/exonuclease/phosphatase family metal-dependent hydrolase